MHTTKYSDIEYSISKVKYTEKSTKEPFGSKYSRNNPNHPRRLSTTRRSRHLLRNQRNIHTRTRRIPSTNKTTHMV